MDLGYLKLVAKTKHRHRTAIHRFGTIVTGEAITSNASRRRALGYNSTTTPMNSKLQHLLLTAKTLFGHLRHWHTTKILKKQPWCVWFLLSSLKFAPTKRLLPPNMRREGGSMCLSRGGLVVELILCRDRQKPAPFASPRTGLQSIFLDLLRIGFPRSRSLDAYTPPSRSHNTTATPPPNFPLTTEMRPSRPSVPDCQAYAADGTLVPSRYDDIHPQHTYGPG